MAEMEGILSLSASSLEANVEAPLSAPGRCRFLFAIVLLLKSQTSANICSISSQFSVVFSIKIIIFYFFCRLLGDFWERTNRWPWHSPGPMSSMASCLNSAVPAMPAMPAMPPMPTMPESSSSVTASMVRCQNHTGYSSPQEDGKEIPTKLVILFTFLSFWRLP